MRHDFQIRQAFDEAFSPKGKATAKAVNEACKVVFEKAAKEFGEEGIYVDGMINHDMGGVSFRFKRPSVGLRVYHFIECDVPKPPRKKK